RAGREDRVEAGLRLARRYASGGCQGNPSMMLLLLLLAHESSVSSSRLEVDGRELRATFTFSLEDLAGLARLDLNRDGTVDPDEWTRVLPGIFSYVGEKFRIEGCR